MLPAPKQDWLGKAEKLSSNAQALVQANQRLLTAIGGSVLLLHGQALSTTVLFIQSFRAAGMPVVQRG